jgi:hypothetical protein
MMAQYEGFNIAYVAPTNHKDSPIKDYLNRDTKREWLIFDTLDDLNK